MVAAGPLQLRDRSAAGHWLESRFAWPDRGASNVSEHGTVLGARGLGASPRQSVARSVPAAGGGGVDYR
jgi:hypothetical protein